MRIVDPPSLDSPWRGRPGDDLDGLLSAFFRSEMPHPWPGPELPGQQPTIARLPAARTAPRSRGFLGSRFALAASLALMLGSLWLLSGKFQSVALPGGAGGRMEPPTATRVNPFITKETTEVGPDGEAVIKINVRPRPPKSLGDQLKNKFRR